MFLCIVFIESFITPLWCRHYCPCFIGEKTERLNTFPKSDLGSARAGKVFSDIFLTLFRQEYSLFKHFLWNKSKWIILPKRSDTRNVYYVPHKARIQSFHLYAALIFWLKSRYMRRNQEDIGQRVHSSSYARWTHSWDIPPSIMQLTVPRCVLKTLLIR